jgi:protein disulfide-isomerase A6
MRFLALVACLVAASAASAVVSLTDATFDSYVGGSKATLVKFFAPWCGHCKALAPEYEKAAEAFEGSSRVAIAEVDCTQQASLCEKFGVQGYPTMKYFAKGDKKPTDYSGGRTADDIVKFIESKGIKKSGSKSNVVILTAATFDKVALDASKDVLVKFFAPWCGHCKALAPAFETVSAVFSNEESLVIAEVNCDEEKDLCTKYGVTGFPTLKWFPKANKAGEAYEGGREVQAFVDYLNNKCGFHRTVTGRLNEQAGRIAALDAIAERFIDNEDKAAAIASAKQVLDVLSSGEAKMAKFYVKIMENVVEKGKDFVANEKTRLQRVLDGGVLSGKKAYVFANRINILNAF